MNYKSTYSTIHYITELYSKIQIIQYNALKYSTILYSIIRQKNSIRYYIVICFFYGFLLRRNLGNFVQKSTKALGKNPQITSCSTGAWPHKLIFLTKRHTKSQQQLKILYYAVFFIVQYSTVHCMKTFCHSFIRLDVKRVC
jgi:hypothetical protein